MSGFAVETGNGPRNKFPIALLCEQNDSHKKSFQNGMALRSQPKTNPRMLKLLRLPVEFVPKIDCSDRLLVNYQVQKESAEDCGCERRRLQSYSSLDEGVGQNLLNWEDAAGVPSEIHKDIRN